MIKKYDIGCFISKQRKNIGITQKELAEKLHISPQAISKWETGETLPDTTVLLDLADALETTVDKILTGGVFVLNKHKRINMNNVIEGLNALEDLKTFFGEKSSFYRGAIEGINNKMNIDFEKYIKEDDSKEVIIAEIIIQYLMDGYQTTKEEIDNVVKSKRMRDIVYKYIGEKSKLDKLYYEDSPELFNKIRAIEPEFNNLNELNLLPGDYLHLEHGKDYWANQVDTEKGFCYGIAVDKKKIRVFTYGFGGENMTLIHEIDILNK